MLRELCRICSASGSPLRGGRAGGRAAARGLLSYSRLSAGAANREQAHAIGARGGPTPPVAQPDQRRFAVLVREVGEGPGGWADWGSEPARPPLRRAEGQRAAQPAGAAAVRRPTRCSDRGGGSANGARVLRCRLLRTRGATHHTTVHSFVCKRRARRRRTQLSRECARGGARRSGARGGSGAGHVRPGGGGGRAV